MNTVTVYISNEELNVLEEIFKAEPDFAPRTKEDYVFWLKIAKKNIKFYGLNKKLSSWRRTSNSLSSNFFQKIFPINHIF